MRNGIKKLLTIILILALVIPLTSCSTNQKEIFVNTDGSVAANNDTYPFNQEDISIESVGFDVVYGTSKPLMRYRGEVPFKNTRDKDEKPYNGFTQSPYNVKSPDIEDLQYWGRTGLVAGEDENGMDGRGPIDLQAWEEVNEDSVKSLRLYALQNAGSGAGTFLYSIMSFFVRLMTNILGYVVMLKNISVEFILDSLQLENLVKVFNNIFISTTTASGNKILSPFMIIAIISFIASLVSYVYRYVRGMTKRSGLFKDILKFALIGLLILGMALNPTRLTTIGDKASNIVTEIVIGLSPEQSDNKMFRTKTSGAEADTNHDNMLTSISTINKIYMDSQIAAQFNVDSIDKLAFSEFGDPTGELAKNTLIGLPGGADSLEHINNNLGYYFWFADSGNKNMSSGNTELPIARNYQQDKLTSMVTYLQKAYNRADDNRDEKTKAHILNIMYNISSPSTVLHATQMFILFVIYVLLFIALWKYALKVAMAKLEIFAAMPGLSIAGPLIVSTNKKLVTIGNGILGIFIMSFAKIFVFSAFFDLILYLVSTILTTNVVVMIIVGLMLYMFRLIAPAIENSFDQFFKGMERRYAPNAGVLKDRSRTWLKHKTNALKSDVDNSKKFVGRDENGQAIYKSRKGGLLSTALGVASNAMDDNTYTKKSVRKVFSDSIKAGKAANKGVKERVLDGQLAQESKRVANLVENQSQINLDNAYGTENTEAQEKELDKVEARLNEINADKEFIQLSANKDNLSDLEKVKLDNFESEIKDLNAQKRKMSNNINTGQRIGSQISAEQQYAEDYRQVLQDKLKAYEKSIEEGDTSIDTIQAHMLARKNLIELDKGKLISKQLGDEDKKKATVERQALLDGEDINAVRNNHNDLIKEDVEKRDDDIKVLDYKPATKEMKLDLGNKINADQPQVETEKPEVDTEKPRIETNKPNIETNKPSVETAKPTAEPNVNNPKVETNAQTSEAKVETNKPDINNTPNTTTSGTKTINEDAKPQVVQETVKETVKEVPVEKEVEKASSESTQKPETVIEKEIIKETAEPTTKKPKTVIEKEIVREIEKAEPTKQTTSEKPVAKETVIEKETVKEVPVEKEVVRETIKEVPVEREVEKEVIGNNGTNSSREEVVNRTTVEEYDKPTVEEVLKEHNRIRNGKIGGQNED